MISRGGAEHAENFSVLCISFFICGASTNCLIWDSRWLFAAYYGLRGPSLLFLPFALAGASPALVLFAIWYGLYWIATVPPKLRLANEAFGRTRAPIVFGCSVETVRARRRAVCPSPRRFTPRRIVSSRNGCAAASPRRAFRPSPSRSCQPRLPSS